MRIIRYAESDRAQLAAVKEDSKIYPLPYQNFQELLNTCDQQQKSCLTLIKEVLDGIDPIQKSIDELDLKLPINAQEVWASGVTYLRSKDARNYESQGSVPSVSYYDKVYVAERPELFLKSTDKRTIGPNDPLYLRSDSTWQIPEPELGLVLDGAGNIVGYTIGNDMSCRDIEGENPLYLPQAKMWKHSCSIGPAILLADTVEDPYAFDINCRIFRNGEKVFEDAASTSQLKRRYEELVEFLKRDNELFPGTVLLTGTCIVPPNDFTLNDGDVVEIEISSIGLLRNPVAAQ
ncbi:fumarylacetoacetate hydrolase family protein [Lederbergia wuyishanensis]|uniref:2-dehydro-3-deoxy-D-arabinonate dehydratase n=1 Tax=Lederbergia wuyishanensis TaxID=1347903 RepID=A0ABU0D9V2_9BACI|nr:fumarylacetoacetate hydrolase family protein [Lederbergia wuyishanensis]MCJ8008443.1 fumarylacetoacetate hydrolase family protein [Lederbergia wuyishanensis]MDQ0345186.1 2-dehydro-3-deoxy-D-arabinonate dehydratase [Lederbergia wuyishanensis]